MRTPLLSLPALLCLVLSAAAAAPLAREDVPGPLAPWVRWVLAGHEEALCPALQGRLQHKPCAWPGTLRLEMGEKGGRFDQAWRAYADSWVPLPGDAARWPQELRVDGVPAAAVDRGGPALRLKAGPHTVSGAFRWDSRPELLKVPSETGILALSVAGSPVPFPVRDEQGRLWLQRVQAEDKEKSHLEVAVHRRVVDEVPLQLITQMQIKASGKNREALLGRALPRGFLPMALWGALPARLEPDGKLRVQVRAGTWDIQIVARHEGPAGAVLLPEPGGPWDEDEAWVFESRNELRIVSVEGAPPLDPQQTELPMDWRQFPAYLMKPGASMRFIERRRGDSDPKPDRLSLSRTLWLDFDGGGLSAQDSISGTLSRSWRLEMGADTALGRVAVGGQDQLITSLRPGGPSGIELRQGQIQLTADSRVAWQGFSIPALGWSHDFEQVSARLHLPPGWRLVHAQGVDQASPTWVSAWTLLDIFLVLITALSAGKLYGGRWGLAALAAAGLSWHEPFAPRWVWLLILAAEALVRALPGGSLGRWTKVARAGAWGGLVLIAVPFMISQVRAGLYPQLERAYAAPPLGMPGLMSAAAPQEFSFRDEEAKGMEVDDAPQAEPPASPAPQRVAAVRGMAGQSLALLKSKSDSLDRYDYDKRARLKQFLALDPKTVVNTGPGLPNWSWRVVSLNWRGPVESGQTIRLWLIPPSGRLALCLLRVVLIAALALLLFGLPVAQWLLSLRGREGWAASWRWLFPAALLIAAWPGSVSAQFQGASFPSGELLNELRQRLLENPECAPTCAESPRLRLEATPSLLRARLEVHAAAATAVPLPGGMRQWNPDRVLLDGAPAPGVRRSEDGVLWLPVSAGPHQVLLEGALPERDSVQIPLPLKPRQVEASVTGWVLHGVVEDGRSEDNLQLTRVRGGPSPGSLQPGALPPFVRVERTLQIGLSWQVETRVVRLTPTGAPIVLQVPLLAGESVMTADLRVSEGKVQVSMSPQASQVLWVSALAETDKLSLKAPDATSWTESWRLEAGPLWHVEARGIPTVHREPDPSARWREWRPWPGETVEISLSRPPGVAGQTLTIDQAVLTLSPGLRSSDLGLTVRLRTSRGGQHALTLPEGADLRSVSIDGVVQPIRQEGRQVRLPLQPGTRTAQVSWRQQEGIRGFLRTPEVGLGAKAVNAALSVQMPSDRWTLLVGGPLLGPAVLFWSLLAVFLFLSMGLGRLGVTPLKWHQWFLLSIGLTQVPVTAAAIVAGWLVALGYRKERPPVGAREFDVLQVFLAFLTFLALACLFRSIKRGLLGLPDMQIGGNGSSASLLQWYQDRMSESMPRAWVLSVPLLVYRAAMLGWALWLAAALLSWLRWGWECFNEGGIWRPLRSSVMVVGDAPPGAKPV